MNKQSTRAARRATPAEAQPLTFGVKSEGVYHIRNISNPQIAQARKGLKGAIFIGHAIEHSSATGKPRVVEYGYGLYGQLSQLQLESANGRAITIEEARRLARSAKQY